MTRSEPFQSVTKTVVEIKSIDRLLTVHEAQLLTYLRMTNSPAGLLINFNVARLLDGLKRVINSKYVEPTATAHP